jgi:hypothetical protein
MIPQGLLHGGIVVLARPDTVAGQVWRVVVDAVRDADLSAGFGTCVIFA